jgi:hypothetical protein
VLKVEGAQLSILNFAGWVMERGDEPTALNTAQITRWVSALRAPIASGASPGRYFESRQTFGFSTRPCYPDGVTYEWDPRKAKSNLRRHGISFEEAGSVFLDPLAITFPDPDHSDEEDREITIGLSKKHRVVFVSHCPRGDRTRIISVRRATRKERKHYEAGKYQ